jgi:hypothetical protein
MDQIYYFTKDDLLSMIALTLHAVLRDVETETIVEMAELLFEDVTIFYLPKN